MLNHEMEMDDQDLEREVNPSGIIVDELVRKLMGKIGKVDKSVMYDE